MPNSRAIALWIAATLALGCGAGVCVAASRAERLLAAYPDHLERLEGNDVVWRDGTRMPLDDGRGPKSFDEWLKDPDIEDMLQKSYPADAEATPPAKDFDPGRARNAPFFDKMYGSCTKGEVQSNLVEIIWLPRKSGHKLKVTRINRVNEKLAQVSAELDALPASFNSFIMPSAGTYSCRPIAGTDRASAHGHGIAIDIAVKRSDYWRWHKPGADARYVYRNQIPLEIVRIFEKHGFIWGGRWYHFDTMHFEYRPELIEPKP